MPLIDYECANCHHIEEHLVKTVETAKEQLPCPLCGAPATLLSFYPSTSFVLRGSWFKDGY